MAENESDDRKIPSDQPKTTSIIRDSKTPATGTKKKVQLSDSIMQAESSNHMSHNKMKQGRAAQSRINAGYDSAKEMLIQSIKKDNTSDKMSFATGLHSSTAETEGIDEMLEELLDQLDMPQLQDDLLEEYTEIYTLIDPKNDGYIDAPKLFKALHTVGFEPTEAEVMDIIDAVDINKSEKIEFVELVDMMLSRDQPTLTDKELRDAFCLFDADEDGIISADDVKPIFSRFGYDLDDEEINDVIMVADYNKDGVVTMEDFMTAVKRQSEKPFKLFDWETIMDDDDRPVGVAYEPRFEDDYFDDENDDEEEDEEEEEDVV